MAPAAWERDIRNHLYREAEVGRAGPGLGSRPCSQLPRTTLGGLLQPPTRRGSVDRLIGPRVGRTDVERKEKATPGFELVIEWVVYVSDRRRLIFTLGKNQ